MRVNLAKQKMLQGKPAFGYALSMASPIAAEKMARCGIDWLLIDCQHGSYHADSMVATMIACEGGSAIPMARVARNDYTLIGRLLDEGAMGIVVPMVHTVEDARAAAFAMRYPPKGGRSWGWSRASTYGGDYPDWIDNEVFLAVQIESVQAVENAEAIMAVPGVDGCWVGPGDLALSMGIHPREQWTNDRHIRALERVIEACHNTGKIPGFCANDPQDALRRARAGFQFLTAGDESGFMMAGAVAGVREFAKEY